MALAPETNIPEDPTTIPKPGLLDLPAELLGEVLLIARLTDHKIPMVFTAINSFLRNVTISNPILWTNIHIMHGPKRTSLQLRCSQQMPLTVCASLQPNCTAERGEVLIRKFLRLLIPHTGRIRHFESVNCWPEWTEHAVAFLEGKPFDRLESLDVGLAESTLSQESVEREVDLMVLSGVRELTLRGTRMAWPPTANVIPFRFHQLTTFYMDGTVAGTLDDILGMLSAMPSLQHLSLRDPAVLPSIAMPQIPLPGLKTLIVTRAENTFLRNLIRSLSTPNLESLSIHFISPRAGFAEGVIVLQGPLPGTVIRGAVEANPQLRRVDLTNCFMSVDDWTATTLGLSAVTHLRISTSVLEDHFLQALAEGACPRLEHLTVDSELELTTGVIKDIVTSHVSSIREAILRGWDPDNVKEEHTLEIQEVVENLEIGLWDTDIIQEAPPDDVSDSDAETGSDWENGRMASGDEMVVDGLVQAWDDEDIEQI